MDELRIENEEIKDFLLNLNWLTYYSGRGDHFFANFVSMPEGEIKSAERCKDTHYPLYNKSFSTVNLSKEYYATYSFPTVHFQIAKSGRDDITYDVIVHFAHRRAGDGYEQVFRGYIQNVEELKQLFNLLGIDKNSGI